MRFCLILLAVIYSAFICAAPKDVLVIHSYHQGFFWTDDFQKGLEQEIKDSDISTRVLYLDTKRLQSDSYLDQLYLLYKTKFEQESYSAIVVSDNNALALVNKLGNVIGDTPVVFGGINNYSASMHDRINATGVTEEVDFESNLALIKRIQPQVKMIYAISDHSITGEAMRSQINQLIEQQPDLSELVIQYVPDTFEQLQEFVSQLDPQESVLFLVYYRDVNGQVLNERQQWLDINSASSAPLYMVHGLDLGYGAVGGVIQHGEKHGQQVAMLLLEVLAQPERKLPDVQFGKSEIKLDFQSVMKWGLGVEREEASALLNKPLPFLEQYENELKLLGGLSVFLTFVILALVYYVGRIKHSELSAKQSQTMMEMVFDQSFHFIGVIDAHGVVISSNSKLQQLLYDQGFGSDEPIWQHKHWQHEAAAKLEEYFANNDKQAVIQFEAELWHLDLGSLVLEISLRGIPAIDEEVAYLLEARDITSRKVTEERLFQREANLSHYYDKQPVMMITVDEQNRIQQVNQFGEQLLGYSADQLLGHRPREFYANQDELIPRQVLLQPQRAINGIWRREVEYRHASGATLWIRENIRPLAESGYLLIVGEDVTETQELAKQLKYQAQHDMLTGIYGRNYFEQQLEQALLEVASHTRTHAMLYIDLDQLKVLNDTAGHEAGDAAIQFCASMLEEILPYNTVLARMGGDEFAILLKHCTEVDAKKLATSIISTLSEYPFIWEDIRLNLNCSIGIRLIDHTASSPQMVHAQADTACHVAKEEGRNRYSLYSLDDKELQRREQEMESVNLVHDALANDRIELFAQQILDLANNSCPLHFEVLVRIKSSCGEYISPAIFMPASERYNIAHLLDKRIVSLALSWFEQNPTALEALGKCAINLSGHSMGNHEFTEFLLDRLSTSTVPCDKICFEITETAAMSNMNLAIEFFTKLKALGCKIALDDFGSGLSSFGYLKKLPVDIVKIDGLFVRDMDVNEMDHLMVRSINDLAQQMGKKTVAEFVENTRIIDSLKELGVDYAQGYIIGKPQPLAKLVNELLVTEKVENQK